MICSNCGATNPDGTSFCSVCGSALPKNDASFTQSPTFTQPGVGKKYCKNCGAQIDMGAAICTQCGFSAGTGNRFCQVCGSSVQPGQAACVKCGAALNGAAGNLSGAKSKIAAGLLGIFLGAFGVHNFYLGKTNRALVQLLVSVIGGLISCGIATLAIEIWGLIEGIFILIGKDGYTTDAQGRPLND